jgi:hypothetical protein
VINTCYKEKEEMAKIELGDKVRIKDRKDWPTPPGYRLANSEGTVVKICEWMELLDEFPEYVKVQIEKTESDNVVVGTQCLLLKENLEKI